MISKSRRSLAAGLLTIATLAGCDLTPLYIGWKHVADAGSGGATTTVTGGAGGGLLCTLVEREHAPEPGALLIELVIEAVEEQP